MSKIKISFDHLSPNEKVDFYIDTQAQVPLIKKDLAEKHHQTLSLNMHKDWVANVQQQHYDKDIILEYVLFVDENLSFLCSCVYSLKDNFKILKAEFTMTVKTSYGRDAPVFKVTSVVEEVQALLAKDRIKVGKYFNELLSVFTKKLEK